MFPDGEVSLSFGTGGATGVENQKKDERPMLNEPQSPNLRTPADSALSRKVVRGGFWTFSLRIIERLLSLVRLIVVARLLSPNDFGLFGVAVLIANILNIFLESGFENALIQKKESVERFLDTAWTMQVLRGAFIFLAMYWGAPFAAGFFNEPNAELIIRVFAFTQFFDGFKNIGVIYFQKNINFKQQFLYRFFPEAIALAATIPAAFILRSVWALVIGGWVGSLGTVIFSYFFQPYRPRWELDFGKIKDLMRFGKWVLAAGILGFLIIQGDDIFVGKFLGIAVLGLYQMAYAISNLPATQITHVISQVTFPAYAKIQDDLPRLREAYLRVVAVTTFFSFPAAGLIFILGPLFTRLFLGQQWLAMVPALQMLCLFGVTRSFNATTGPVFNGVGRPRDLTWLNWIQLMILAVLIYPLTKQWGILGAAAATVIPNFVTLVLASVKIAAIFNCRPGALLKPLIVPLCFSGIMIGCLGVLLWVVENQGVVFFVSAALIGIAVYLGVSYVFGRFFGYDPGKMLSGVIREIRA